MRAAVRLLLVVLVAGAGPGAGLAAADPGALDPSFGTGGYARAFAGVQLPAEHVVAQPDGRVVALDGTGTRVARFLADGSLDPAFAGTGTVTLAPPGLGPLGHDLVVQPDGKLLVVGELSLREAGFEPDDQRVFVARLHADGTLDTGFGDDGYVLLQLGVYTQDGRLAVQDDGAIVVGVRANVQVGTYLDGNAIPRPRYGARFGLTRLLASGAPDPGFGTNGTVITDVGDDGTRIASLLHQPGDGKLVAAGDEAVARYEPDGALDASFGHDGTGIVHPTDQIAGAALQSDGAIVLARSQTGPVGTRLAVRLDAGGELDAGFAPASIRNNTGLRALAVDAADRIVLAGDYNAVGDTHHALLLRLEADGSYDTGFGDAGAGGPYAGREFYDVALDGDGRIVAPGGRSHSSPTAFTVARVLGRLAAPVNEAPPTVTGLAEDGGLLTADPGTWRNGTPAFSYRWQRCTTADACADIPGAAAREYRLTPADVDHLVRVVVTATTAAGATEAASAATARVAARPPQSVRAVAVDAAGRDLRVGETVGAVRGAWDGTPPFTFAYRWQRCRGDDCADIAGAANADYVVADADVGARLRVLETASNAAGSGTHASAATGAVLAPDAAAQAPTVAAGPEIAPAGAVEAGQELRLTARGAFTGSEPLTYALRWQRCATADGGCEVIAGADGERYATTAADAGAFVRLRVTASNAAGSASAASTARAVRARPVPTAVVTPSPTVPPPPPVLAEDTTRVARMPDVRGLPVDGAKTRIEAGMYARIDVRYVFRDKPPTARGRTIEPGEVFSQSVPPGAVIRGNALANPRRLRLVVNAGARGGKRGEKAAECVLKPFRRELRGLDLGEALDLLQGKRCRRLNLNFVLTDRVDDAEVRAAGRDGKELDLKVLVSRDAQDHDLFAFATAGQFGSGLPTLADADWALTAGTRNVFGARVVDRAGRFVSGAKVLLDGRGVDADDEIARTGDGGTALFNVTPRTPGLVNFVLQAEDADGDTIHGFGQLRAVRRRGAFTTIAGERFRLADDGSARAAGARPTAQASIVPVVFAFLAVEALRGLFGGEVAQLFATATDPERTLRQAARKRVTLVQLLIDGPASAAAGLISTLAAPVVSAGGGNVISAGAGNVVSAGGGNVISAGGGNVISAGGGNAIGGDVFRSGTGQLVQIPSTIAGKVVSAGGGNVIAAGGGNVVSAGGGNVISAGGGN